MRPKLLRKKNKTIHFELVPMIDVMMILCIFLAVMAFLPQTPESLKTNLPSAKSAEEQSPGLTVAVNANGVISVGDRPLTMLQLSEFLTPRLRQKPDQTVILAADKSLPYAQVIQVMDTIKASGARKLALAAESPK